MTERAAHYLWPRADVADGPCERFKCPKAEACKHEHLACEAFRHFVATGRVIPPWRHPEDRGRPKALHRGNPVGPRPTRRIYLLTFPSKDPVE